METGKLYCKNGHVQVSCTIIILFNEGSSSSQPVYWLRISVSNQFRWRISATVSDKLYYYLGYDTNSKCVMSLPSLSTIGLWTSIGSIYFVIRGKTLKKAKITTTSSYSRDRSLTIRGSKPFHWFPFPRPSQESECCWIVAQFQIVERNQPILIR